MNLLSLFKTDPKQKKETVYRTFLTAQAQTLALHYLSSQRKNVLVFGFHDDSSADALFRGGEMFDKWFETNRSKNTKLRTKCVQQLEELDVSPASISISNEQVKTLLDKAPTQFIGSKKELDRLLEQATLEIKLELLKPQKLLNVAESKKDFPPSLNF